MSLRVTRPTINLREKVNSLDHDIGAHGGALMRSRTPAETFNLVQAGRRNLIINGGMEIYQRGSYNTAVDVPNGNTYWMDRWLTNVAAEFNNEVEIFQNKADIYPPAGFRYCMSMRCKTASFGTSGAYWNFRQKIEGTNMAHLHWGYEDAKPVSLQFWVRANRTGSYAVSMRNAQSDWSIVYPYTINQADTWQHVKIENIPGAVHESWSTGTGEGMTLNFGFGSSQNTSYRVKEGELGVWQATGSTGYVTQRDFTDRVDNQLHLTGVQLEQGSFCTPFDHRPYGEELHLCMRYYYKLHNADGDQLRFVGYGGGGTSAGFSLIHKPPMRDTPTGLLTVSSGNFSYNDGIAAYSGNNGGGGWSFSGNRFSCDVNTTTDAANTAIRSKALSIYSGGSGTTIELNAEL